MERQKMLTPVAFLPFFADRVEPLERDGVVQRKSPAGGPLQRRDMGVAAKRFAEITCNRAHIAALAADELELRRIRVGARQQGQPLDKKRAGRKVKLHPLAREIIGALALDPHGRELWRDLLDIAREAGQGGADLVIARALVAARDHLAFGVIGGGALAKPDAATDRESTRPTS